MDEHYAIRLLAEAKKIFDKYNIECWLDTGTLLGAVRNGRLIPWDKDCDLGTWYDNAPRLNSILHEFRNRGLEAFLEEYRYEFVVKSKRAKLDVFLYRLINGWATWTLYINKNLIGAYLASLQLRFSNVNPDGGETPLRESLKRPVIEAIRLLPASARRTLAKVCFLLYKEIGSQQFVFRIPREYFTNLQRVRFYGIEFKVPRQTRKYLTLRYGKAWQIPDRKWVYDKDIPLLALEGETLKQRKHQE